MTNRELSEVLAEIADELDFLSEGNQSNVEYRHRLMAAADRLHDLSNEKYTPGSISWQDLKKQTPNTPSKTMKYTNKQGKVVPF